MSSAMNHVKVFARVLSQEPESVEAVLKLAEMPKDKRPRYTFSRYDWGKAEELYRAGKSDAAIAKVLGCSESTVWQWRAAFGLPTNNPKRKKVEQ